MPLQLTSTSFKQEWHVQHGPTHTCTNTRTHTPLSGRYPVVSYISVASSSASWKRNVCWSQRGNLCMTNLWVQITAICQSVWWKTNKCIWEELDCVESSLWHLSCWLTEMSLLSWVWQRDRQKVCLMRGACSFRVLFHSLDCVIYVWLLCCRNAHTPNCVQPTKLHNSTVQ